jgi:hypothetical protein
MYVHTYARTVQGTGGVWPEVKYTLAKTPGFSEMTANQKFSVTIYSEKENRI